MKTIEIVVTCLECHGDGGYSYAIGDQEHETLCPVCEGRCEIYKQLDEVTISDFINEEIRKGNTDAIRLI
jgi:DnaJ-class molecular chaperone